MKTFSPKYLSIYISLIVSIISGILFLLSNFVNKDDYWKFLIILVLMVFVMVYLAVNYIINKFIVEKIKPIYKTIHSFSVSDEKLNENIDDKDIISVVKEDVSLWAKDKTREIDKLKATAKYRREFLGNISHELKTPIFNIQGYLLTLLDGALDDKEINKKYLLRAEKSLERLINIVNNLEAISQLESGELKLNYENFDIIKLLEDIIDSYELIAKTKGTKISIINNLEKVILVKADKQQIYQVLNNLLLNSIKYGRKDGCSEVEFFDMDDKYLVEISDNGIGIPKSVLPRLFERFYRVDKSRTREEGGTGLGLAIVKHIIEAHNQTLNVRSQINEGSTFSFTIEKAK